MWILVALVFWGVTALLPGFDVPSFGAALLTTAVIAVINALLWPLVIRVLLPLAVFSFGLGSLVLNAVVVGRRRVGRRGGAPFLDAIAAAFVLSLALQLLPP